MALLAFKRKDKSAFCVFLLLMSKAVLLFNSTLVQIHLSLGSMVNTIFDSVSIFCTCHVTFVNCWAYVVHGNFIDFPMFYSTENILV